jgi:hypothetical protein
MFSIRLDAVSNEDMANARNFQTKPRISRWLCLPLSPVFLRLALYIYAFVPLP